MNNNLEAIKDAHDYGEKLIKGVIKTSECFQSYDESAGADLMINIIDGLQWYMAAAAKYSVLNNTDEINNVNDKLKELVEAFENQDYVLIGDLLQYELLPIIEYINNKLGEMIKN
ncbi:MAG: hypothetical protein ACM3X7_10800 [Solirubrobacterales bacterium]